jgi:hypothetical protein
MNQYGDVPVESSGLDVTVVIAIIVGVLIIIGGIITLVFYLKNRNAAPATDSQPAATADNKSATDTAPANKSTTDTAPADKAPADKAPADKAPVDKAPVVDKPKTDIVTPADPKTGVAANTTTAGGTVTNPLPPGLSKCTACKSAGMYWCPPGALPAPYSGGGTQISNYRVPQYDPVAPQMNIEGVGYYFRQSAPDCGVF